MRAQLTARERTLATAVGTVVFLLLNFVVINYFVKNHARLRGDLGAKTSQLQAMQALFADQEAWVKVDAWVQATQPKLENEATAAGVLLEDIRLLAKKTNVQPLAPQLGTPERRPQYTAVSVTIDMKGAADAMRDFLYEMQAPERFIVFESANLQIDQEDKTKILGKFRIAKWFAAK